MHNHKMFRKNSIQDLPSPVVRVNMVIKKLQNICYLHEKERHFWKENIGFGKSREHYLTRTPVYDYILERVREERKASQRAYEMQVDKLRRAELVLSDFIFSIRAIEDATRVKSGCGFHQIYQIFRKKELRIKNLSSRLVQEVYGYAVYHMCKAWNARPRREEGVVAIVSLIKDASFLIGIEPTPKEIMRAFRDSFPSHGGQGDWFYHNIPA
jgi:hypothetical protein